METYLEAGYNELKGNLSVCSAVVLFRKKTGQVRAMFCTRDSSEVIRATGVDFTIQLHGHDKRNTEENKTLAVIDLVKEQARAFSTERILGLTYLPPLIGDVAINQAYEYYNQVAEYAKQLNATEKENAARFREQVAVQGGGGECI